MPEDTCGERGLWSPLNWCKHQDLSYIKTVAKASLHHRTRLHLAGFLDLECPILNRKEPYKPLTLLTYRSSTRVFPLHLQISTPLMVFNGEIIAGEGKNFFLARGGSQVRDGMGRRGVEMVGTLLSDPWGAQQAI